MPKISELPAETTPTSDDLVPMVDMAGAITKRLTLTGLAGGIAGFFASGAIAGSKLADGAVTNAKLAAQPGEIGGAWQSWTPTWTNLTVGNGTVTARYTHIGKLYHFNLVFTLGSSSSVGTFASFSLPATAVTSAAQAGIVHFIVNDVGIANYDSSSEIASGATSVGTVISLTNGTWSNTNGVTSTTPMTWASGDSIRAHGWYEAA